MTTLDTTDHDDWLADIRDRLTRTCDELTSRLADLTTDQIDPTDAADHRALLTATRQSLAEATEALQRIDQGTYGTCEACGTAIPAERLDIRPQARRCVSCPR